MSETKKLKYYYDIELAELLAEKIKKHYTEFDNKKFIDNIAKEIDSLELKARVALISDSLQRCLPQKYPEAIEILLQILGPENPNETGMFTEWYWLMPVAFFVEKYGLDDFEVSVNAISEITKRHTGEYTVRPFLEKYTEQMLGVMIEWSNNDNFHLRRLASEGIRPRLPWHRRLKIFIEKPELILPILENLKEDEIKFVQKSVANCMNDILKDNYEIAMTVLKKWAKSENENTRWIVKHALRNEIKKGNKEVIELVRND
jgi:3-methyladenine DNA glycosylase AlkC